MNKVCQNELRLIDNFFVSGAACMHCCLRGCRHCASWLPTAWPPRPPAAQTHKTAIAATAPAAPALQASAGAPWTAATGAAAATQVRASSAAPFARFSAHQADAAETFQPLTGGAADAFRATHDQRGRHPHHPRAKLGAQRGPRASTPRAHLQRRPPRHAAAAEHLWHWI